MAIDERRSPYYAPRAYIRSSGNARMPVECASRRSEVTRWGPSATLIGILVLALFVRFQGITYGLPLDFYAPDEAVKAGTVAQFRHGAFIHPSPRQPLFLLNTAYLFQFATRPFKEELLTRISAFGTMSDEMLERAFLIWSSRLWLALIGAATCGLVFLLGKRLWNEIAGLFAAFFYALWPLPVAATHYVKEDTPLAFFTTLVLLLCLSLLRHGRRRDYVLVGLCCGLAFGAKYPGAFTLFALLAAHLLRLPEGKAKLLPRGFVATHLAPLGLAFATGVFGFALASPQHLVQIPYFLSEGLIWQSKYLVSGHLDGIRVDALPEWFTFYLRKGLWPGLAVGLPIAIAGWLTAICMLKNETDRLRSVALVAGWMSSYYLVAESVPTKPYPFFARYVLPTVPLLAIGAGISCSLLWDQLKPRDSARSYFAGALLILIVAATILPATLLSRYVLPDTRDLAMEWLDRRSGRLIVEGYFVYPVEFRDEAAGKWKVIVSRKCFAEIEEVRDEAGGAVYVGLNSFNTDRWLAYPEVRQECSARIQRILKEGRLVMELRKPWASYGYHNPDIRIYQWK